MADKVLIKGIIGFIIIIAFIVGDIWLFSSEYSETGCVYGVQKAKLVQGNYECRWDYSYMLFMLGLIMIAGSLGYKGVFNK